MFRDLIRSHLEKCGYKHTMCMCTCVCAHRYTVHLSPLWKEPLSLDPSTQPSPQYYRLDVLDFWKRVINNGIYACECVHCVCVCAYTFMYDICVLMHVCACLWHHACDTFVCLCVLLCACLCLWAHAHAIAPVHNKIMFSRTNI